MIDEKLPVNIRDRVKTSINHLKMDIHSLNGEVRSKIKQVTINTRKTRNKRKGINIKLEKKDKRQTIYDAYIDKSDVKSDTIVRNYSLDHREKN